jgi:hypothetical protein
MKRIAPQSFQGLLSAQAVSVSRCCAEGSRSSTDDDDLLRLAIDELAQALTIIAPVSTRLRQTLGSANEDAVELQVAVDRAMRAIKRIAPRPDQ